MDRAGGAVPGHAHVPLHVRVVSEQIALGIEGDVVAVTVAAAENLPALALGIGPGDPAPGGEDAAGVAVGVPLAGQELAFAPVFGHETRLKACGRQRVVARDQHDRRPIGRQAQTVWSMFAAPANLFQMSDLIVLVIAISVAQTVQADPPAAVAANVKAVEGHEQTLALVTAAFMRSTLV